MDTFPVELTKHNGKFKPADLFPETEMEKELKYNTKLDPISPDFDIRTWLTDDQRALYERIRDEFLSDFEKQEQNDD